MMRSFFATIALLSFLLPAAAHAQAGPAEPFDGQWEWTRGKESLELTLDQNGEVLTGMHVAIGQNGSKVDDTAEELVPSITGYVAGNVATIDFASAFDGGGTGKATMTVTGDTLEWELTSSKGEHYFPKKAELHRVAKTTP